MSNTSFGYIVFLLGLLTVFVYILYFIFWLPYRDQREYNRWISSPTIQNAKRIMERLYQGSEGFRFSRLDRQQLNHWDSEFTYGEMPFLTWASILSLIQPKPDSVFYDLGSGTGHIVIASALLSEFKKCVGIELLPSLYAYSQERLENLKTYSDLPEYCNPDHIQFLHEDFLMSDLHEATILYINATGFFSENLEKLKHKLNTLHTGCWVIITTKKLSEDHFELIDARVRNMSWGVGIVRVYKKR